MAKKIAQSRFTQRQLDQLENLKRQTALNRTELVRRALDYYILQIRKQGYKSTLIPFQTVGPSETSQK